MRGKLLLSAALILLAAIFAFSACGNKDEAETGQPADTAQATPEAGTASENKNNPQTVKEEAAPTDLKLIAPAGLLQLGELVNLRFSKADPFIIAIYANEDQKNSFKEPPTPQNIWANNYNMTKNGRLAIIARIYPDSYKEFNKKIFNEVYSQAIANGFFEVVEQGESFIFAQLATPPDKAGFTAEALHNGKVYGLYYLGSAEDPQTKEELQKEARAWLGEFLKANPGEK